MMAIVLANDSHYSTGLSNGTGHDENVTSAPSLACFQLTARGASMRTVTASIVRA